MPLVAATISRWSFDSIASDDKSYSRTNFWLYPVIFPLELVTRIASVVDSSVAFSMASKCVSSPQPILVFLTIREVVIQALNEANWVHPTG